MQASAATDQASTNQAVFTKPTSALSDTELRDLAVRLALNGLTLEEGLRYLERIEAVNLQTLEQECASRKLLLSQWIERTKAKAQALGTKIQTLVETAASLTRAKFETEISIQLLELKKSAIRLSMRIKQLETQRTFFEEQKQNLSCQHQEMTERLAHSKEVELGYAKSLHAGLIEIWKTDETELHRRADVLGQEQTRISDRLKPIEERIQLLQSAGITRTTAGFLIWVGYTGFAGVGSVIGGLLQKRQSDPRSADLFGNFIRGFASSFGLEAGNKFMWLPFFKMIGFVVFILALLALVITLWDFLLKRFHTDWTKKEQKRNQSAPKSKQTVLSIFTAGSSRLSLFTGKINRADYVQLLAIGPYLLFAAILVFVISYLGLTPYLGGGQGSQEQSTLTAASFGAIFTLLGTSVCILYATKVIEPRWVKFAKSESPGAKVFLAANWEIIAVVASLVISVLILTFSPFSEASNYRVWGITALFMTLGSIGLAYGLVYRGIFRDYDVLSRIRQEYLLKIQETLVRPTLGDIFESSEPEDLKQETDRLRNAIHYLDGLRIGNDMEILFGDTHPEYGVDFLDFWLSQEPDLSNERLLSLSARSANKISKLIRGLRLPQHRVSDSIGNSWKVAPREAEEYSVHHQQIAVHRNRLSELDNDLKQSVAERSQAEGELSHQAAELRDFETRLWTAETECAGAVRDHKLQKEVETARFTSAFLSGRIVHDYLDSSEPNAGKFEGSRV
jgi:hypothetical protein